MQEDNNKIAISSVLGEKERVRAKCRWSRMGVEISMRLSQSRHRVVKNIATALHRTEQYIGLYLLLCRMAALRASTAAAAAFRVAAACREMR